MTARPSGAGARRRRIRRIAAVLQRHGLGLAAGLLGLDGWIPFNRGVLGHAARDEPYTSPDHVRLALEELGPTFIKLGQLLSTRPDLLPPDYVRELAKLQDGAPADDWESIREVLREELGADPDEVFATFDPQPLAAASIGQAYAATRHDGTEVVVKVRRPGAVAQVTQDLEILQNLAQRAEQRWDQARQFNLPGLVDEFSRTLRAELDYLQEGRNAERFARDFADASDVAIPRVFWETTTSRVLTLQRMRGIRIDDLTALDAAAIDRPQLAHRGAHLILTMVFEHRFFHADPHPGNMFVHLEGSLALIDFGMVGQLDEEVAEQLADILLAFTRADADALTTAVLALSVTKDFADRDELRAAFASFLAQYRDRPVAEINLTRLLGEVLGLLRRHHLQLPQQTALLFKVLMMGEGLASHLDPEFDMMQALAPFSERIIRQRFSLHALAKRWAEASSDAGALLLELPRTLRQLRRVLDANGFAVHLRAQELEPLVSRAERIGNRMVAGLIAAALINGIGELVSGNTGWRGRARVLIGTGASVIGALGGYLLWTTRRRR
ncbi:AarF/ABC1/UbiB kinase family protein [Leucobacter sp. wl10]|uniref:ABC1 kinase family protein n=1 Tax=Leucobacter sp. wl10 TaxID=2304677 RepID=UPI000E5B55A7|nr:AarF/ABC1/UbiB kinase family protein [Leucobacter sp. wl10]RGE19030.1 AarF/ABC1/UbiB kinase family protein [Leucobacter sp. wl10]